MTIEQVPALGGLMTTSPATSLETSFTGDHSSLSNEQPAIEEEGGEGYPRPWRKMWGMRPDKLLYSKSSDQGRWIMDISDISFNTLMLGIA